jgi:transposase
LPPNTIAALRRDMERLKIIKEQIKAIEQARLQQFEQKPEALATGWFICWYGFTGLVWRQPIFWRMSFCPEHYAIAKL